MKIRTAAATDGEKRVNKDVLVQTAEKVVQRLELRKKRLRI